MQARRIGVGIAGLLPIGTDLTLIDLKAHVQGKRRWPRMGKAGSL